jgi:hypothetical protein
MHATLVVLGVKSDSEALVPATAPLPTAMPILTCGATPVIVACWDCAAADGTTEIGSNALVWTVPFVFMCSGFGKAKGVDGNWWARHSDGKVAGCALIRFRDPCRVDAKGRCAAATVAEPAGDGTNVYTGRD